MNNVIQPDSSSKSKHYCVAYFSCIEILCSCNLAEPHPQAEAKLMYSKKKILKLMCILVFW
jgi:hypothetical protein